MDNKQFLMQRIEKTASGCWEWALYRDPDGYGRFTRPRVSPMAHRAAYIIFAGEIPDGYDVDHKCWNPACCNPDHLRILPKSLNRALQRRALNPKCIHGHVLEGDNLFVRESGRIECRECINRRAREYRARKKGVA